MVLSSWWIFHENLRTFFPTVHWWGKHIPGGGGGAGCLPSTGSQFGKNCSSNNRTLLNKNQKIPYLINQNIYQQHFNGVGGGGKRLKISTVERQNPNIFGFWTDHFSSVLKPFGFLDGAEIQTKCLVFGQSENRTIQLGTLS